jgi:hypothetical protein
MLDLPAESLGGVPLRNPDGVLGDVQPAPAVRAVELVRHRTLQTRDLAVSRATPLVKR